MLGSHRLVRWRRSLAVWLLPVGLLGGACRSVPVATPVDDAEPAASPTVSSGVSAMNAPAEETAPRSLAVGTTYTLATRTWLPADAWSLVAEDTVERRELPALPAGDDSARLYYQLDAHSLRPAGRARPLASLLAENVELAPGPHELTALSFSGSHLELQRLPLHVAAEGRSGESTVPSWPSRCQLILPSGTYNGHASDGIELLALAWEAAPAGQEPVPSSRVLVDYRVESVRADPGYLATGSAPSGTSLWLPNAPAGDLQVSARCSFSESTRGSDLRTITLNPELGMPATDPAPADDRDASREDETAPVAAESDVEGAAR